MIKYLNPAEADTLYDDDAARWVDIRDPASFAAGHIDRAVALDNQTVSQFISDTDKSAPVVVCCYHGNSSRQAAAYLVDQGFETVYSLDGGFEQWKILHPERISAS